MLTRSNHTVDTSLRTRTFNEKKEALVVLLQNLDGLLRHLGQTGFSSSVLGSIHLILHVAGVEQAWAT